MPKSIPIAKNNIPIAENNIPIAKIIPIAKSIPLAKTKSFHQKQEHRTEMDARAGTFQALELFGQQLLQGGHYASPDIQENLNNMADARQELEK